MYERTMHIRYGNILYFLFYGKFYTTKSNQSECDISILEYAYMRCVYLPCEKRIVLFL